MNYLLPSAVLLLMLSVGMSLNLRALAGQWRRLTVGQWTRLLLATFIVPPCIALGLGSVLPIPVSATIGLFLIAVAPGAPLMTRGVARRGFDLQVAASYQIWGALLIPIMTPLLVAAAGKLYQRDIWIPPSALLVLIAKQQLIPLIAGMALMHFAPTFSVKVQRAFNLLGNLLLTVAIFALLWKIGPELQSAGPWVPVAAVLLALACMGISRICLTSRTPGMQTLVISNVNRHVGLALLLSGQYLRVKNCLPVIAAYALAAPLLMVIYGKLSGPRADDSPDAPMTPAAL